jgi:hypothetical protein
MACAYPDSSESESSIVQNRIAIYDTDNEASDIETVELPKKRGRGLTYLHYKTFDTIQEAFEAINNTINNEKWRYEYTRKTSDGEKKYYKCAFSNCESKLCCLAHSNSEKASISIAEIEHDHTKPNNPRLGDSVKQDIINLYKLGITKPKAIIRELAKKNIHNIKREAISNFIQRYKNKEFGPVKIGLNDLKEWCDKRRTIPDDDDKVYVEDSDINYVNNQLIIRIFLTTKRLIRFCNLGN